MLRNLRDDPAPEVVQPIEDDAVTAEAAEDDSVLPAGQGGSGEGDGDEPEFLAPR